MDTDLFRKQPELRKEAIDVGDLAQCSLPSRIEGESGESQFPKAAMWGWNKMSTLCLMSMFYIPLLGSCWKQPDSGDPTHQVISLAQIQTEKVMMKSRKGTLISEATPGRQGHHVLSPLFRGFPGLSGFLERVISHRHGCRGHTVCRFGVICGFRHLWVS